MYLETGSDLMHCSGPVTGLVACAILMSSYISEELHVKLQAKSFEQVQGGVGGLDTEV